MSKLTFNDCNGLAGFMSLGFVNTGMEMNVRTGTLDFGNKVDLIILLASKIRLSVFPPFRLYL